ncbi:MAG TPA: hypothetical protein ENK02_09775 [Planctomycetes bacterium]|nr:hypothetical protein [Planctomycetota bacterium]
MIKSISLFVGLLSLATPLPAQGEGSVKDPKNTTLRQIEKTPQAFKNLAVRIEGYFRGIGSLHNAFFTRFTRADFVNFEVWGVTKRLWIKEDFDNPTPTFFVDKRNDDVIDLLSKLKRYQKIACTGIIRNVFRGKPWFEISKIEILPNKLNTASLARMVKARRLMKRRRWEQAGNEFNMAFAPGLDNEVKGWIHYYLGICLMRVGNAERASNQFQRSMALLQDPSIAKDQLTLLSQDPKSVVDQQIDGMHIPKKNRPMWEAVENSKAKTTRVGAQSKSPRAKSPQPAKPGK